MIYFKIKHKFFFGAFIFWFSLVSIVTPFKASAEDYGNIDNDPTVIGEDGLPQGTGNPAKAATNPNSSASGASETGVGDIAQQSAATLVTCSVGAILGRLVSSLIGKLISEMLSLVGSLLGLAGPFTDPEAITAVPVYSYSIKQNTGLSANKEVGGGVQPPTGLFLSLGNISMDSIMFCIVNEIITYITQSTIKWINSGFNGNPVFVQNPGALLQTVADQEANTFIRSLTEGVNQAVSGNGLGVPNSSYTSNPMMQRQVALGLVNYYNGQSSQNSLANIPQPTLSDAQIMALSRGESLGVDINAQQYDPRNTSWGRNNFYYIPALQQNISAAQQNATMRFNAGRGIISPTTCANGYVRPDGTCANYGIMDTSSSYLIGTTLQNRDMMTYTRVALAKDFDAIITALVNQLIKIAVTDISKKTGISPTTIYSTGLGITNQALNGGAAPRAIPVYPQERDANGNLIPKALPLNSYSLDAPPVP